VNQAAVGTDQLIRNITPAFEDFADNGLEDLNRASSDLRRLVATLERIAAEIESNPGAFVAGAPRETVEVPQ
jgi:phospholipid/cholesterol/gamma-HCH transport system substrate-binding protein